MWLHLNTRFCQIEGIMKHVACTRWLNHDIHDTCVVPAFGIFLIVKAEMQGTVQLRVNSTRKRKGISESSDQERSRTALFKIISSLKFQPVPRTPPQPVAQQCIAGPSTTVDVNLSVSEMLLSMRPELNHFGILKMRVPEFANKGWYNARDVINVNLLTLESKKTYCSVSFPFILIWSIPPTYWWHITMQINNMKANISCPITEYLAASAHVDSVVAQTLKSEMDMEDDQLINLYENYFWNTMYRPSKQAQSLPYCADQDVPVEHVSNISSQLIFILLFFSFCFIWNVRLLINMERLSLLFFPCCFFALNT